MQRRDTITVIGISVLALAAALIFGPMFQAGQVEPGEVPNLPTTPVLPDPVRPPPVPPLLSVALLDAESGARIEDGAVLELLRGNELSGGARGYRSGTPLMVSQAAFDVPLRVMVRRDRYLPSTTEVVTLAQGQSPSLEIRLQPTRRVRIAAPATATLLGVARLWPLPQWPDDLPLVRWATPHRGHFAFDLPAGRYICCAPLRDLTRDAQGRPWLSAGALADAPAFAIPGGCQWAEFEVRADGDLQPAFNARTGDLSAAGTVANHEGKPVDGQRIELVRLGPISEVVAETLAGPDGRFAFRGLTPGVYQARPFAVAGNWPWFEAGHSEAVALTLPKPVVAEGAPGALTVQFLRKGEALGGAQMVVLGHYDAQGFQARTGGEILGKGTGFRGVVQWDNVDPGTYRITSVPYSGRTLDVQVRPGLTTDVNFEIAPPGTGELELVGPFARGAWVLLFHESGKPICGAGPDRDGVVRVVGLSEGAVKCTVHEDGFEPASTTVTIVPGMSTRAARPQRGAKLPETQPEAPKEEPIPPTPEPPKEEPAPPKDEAEKNRAAAHDRPIGGVSLKLPIPGQSSREPETPAPPTPNEPLRPAPAPARPAMPVRAAIPTGQVLRIVLDLDPALPELWQAVVTLGDTHCALFDTVTAAQGRVFAGLCMHEGKPTITLRCDGTPPREFSLLLPGYKPVAVTFSGDATQAKARPEKR